MEMETSEEEEPLQMETEEEEEVVVAVVREPPKIQRLDESVVNRIAAGEVIQRPVSAIKELVENSLDANSTSVNVVVKDGGLKLIQVSDDGHGIRYEDLPILCERHTTSKLSKFEDLQSIKSMGFRGEALASMTYVGHVTVTTITRGQLHGYRVSYRDGVMEHEPKACAAVKGTQIMYEDLPILCERHTTSKLSKFEDLQSIKSMGFRGEALASMTYVGHVTVTTITRGQLHGYRVSYRDGVMEHEPKACAAVKGTQIMIENLFYNMAARRKTLQNSADDYPKIVDMLSRFAIHHINVGFSCRKHGAARADVHTVAVSSRLDAIRSVYGLSVARSLIKIDVSDNDLSSSVFEMDGFISNSNYIAKKITMVLYINDRLVECAALKRAIEIVYAATLPKASKPFIYMSIILPPEHVDVNVHPTKREVYEYLYQCYKEGSMAFTIHDMTFVSTSKYYSAFLLHQVSLLNQEVIIEKIQSAVESKLRNSNEARTFEEQTVDPTPSSSMSVSKASPINPSPPGSKLQKVQVNKMVRTDALEPAGRLHAYLQTKPTSQPEKNNNLTSIRSSIRQRRNPKETADLTSIQELINDIDCSCHSGLLDIVRNCIYIGMADDVCALLQHNTHLYLANVVNLSKELMYQQVLQRFAHFNAIQLSDPAPLPELIMLALREEDLDAQGNENDDLKARIAEMNTELLRQKAEMLEEYFCINIDSNGNLSRLPVILDQYTPDMDRVPEFALCLGNDVDWDNEKSCFQSIAASLGNFYAMHPPLLPNPSDDLQFYKRRTPTSNPEGDENSSKAREKGVIEEDEVEQELLSEAENAWAQREWSIQHVLFPSMRLFFKPQTSMATDGTFVQVASLEKLYKIFERC